MRKNFSLVFVPALLFQREQLYPCWNKRAIVGNLIRFQPHLPWIKARCCKSFVQSEQHRFCARPFLAHVVCTILVLFHAFFCWLGEGDVFVQLLNGASVAQALNKTLTVLSVSTKAFQLSGIPYMLRSGPYLASTSCIWKLSVQKKARTVHMLPTSRK